MKKFRIRVEKYYNKGEYLYTLYYPEYTMKFLWLFNVWVNYDGFLGDPIYFETLKEAKEYQEVQIKEYRKTPVDTIKSEYIDL